MMLAQRIGPGRAVKARILEPKASGDGILKIGRKLGIGRVWCSASSSSRRSHPNGIRSDIFWLRELKAEGMGILKIGRTLGIGTSVVQRVISARG
jgi:hypothetical protein